MLKIAYLTSGGAGMYCGSCMRDNTLAAALSRLGCDISLIPTYTPIRTDEENVSSDQVFLGGINVYLQQRLPFLRWLPGGLDRWLNSPWLLNKVGSRGMATSARFLGDLTLSILRGETGRQRKEMHRLTKYLAVTLRPDLINLSNILIAGCLPAIRRAWRGPLLVTLQGDDLFLMDLTEPYRSQALAEVRRLAGLADAFIVFSDYYAGQMGRLLEIPPEKFRKAPMGIAVGDYAESSAGAAPEATRPPTIGFLARLCPSKGLHVLVDAFLQLRQMPGMAAARLKIGGWLSTTDKPYVQEQLQKLRAAGADFEHAGVLDRQQKVAFLSSLDVFSVPTTYREPKGIFVLEALASGVPVVQPAHGAFPELLAATGGGRLVRPDDPADLAQALFHLLSHPEERRALGAVGRRTVLERFTDRQMAEATLAIYREFSA